MTNQEVKPLPCLNDTQKEMIAKIYESRKGTGDSYLALIIGMNSLITELQAALQARDARDAALDEARDRVIREVRSYYGKVAIQSELLKWMDRVDAALDALTALEKGEKE